MKQYAYELGAGDGLAVELSVSTDSNYIDLTDASFVYVLCKTRGGTPLVIKTGTIESGYSVKFVLDSEDTKDIEPGEYFHECKVRDAVNNMPTTVSVIDTITQRELNKIKVHPSSARFSS